MKKQTLFFKLFIALALFIVIPVVILARMVSYRMIRNSEDEIGRYTIGKLKSAEKLNELTANSMNQCALEMTIGTAMNDLNDLTTYADIFNNRDGIMKLYNLQNQMIDLENVSYPSLHSIYLYIDDSDFVLTTNQGAQNIKDFPDIGWMEAYQRFKNTHSGSNWLSTRTIRYSKETDVELGSSSKVVTFFYMFTPYTTTVKGVLVFNVREQAISKLINDMTSSDDGYIEIVNSKGDIISDIHEDMVGKNIKNAPYIQQIVSSKSDEGYFINLNDNKRQLITYLKSDYNDWTYIGIYPVDSLMAKSNKLISYTMYICFAFIFFGILISYFTSRRLYSPLKKLLQDIRIRKGIDIKSNENEMSILSKVYDNLLKKEARLFFILEHKDNIKNAYLTNLIKGKHDEEFDKELTGLDFVYENYIIAVILIDRYKEFDSGYTKEHQDYMRMLILKVSEELLNSTFICTGMVYEKKRIVLIINYGSISDEELKLNLNNIFLKIQGEVNKIFDNTITIGIGDRRESTAGISESFDNAQEALRYKLIKGYGSINFWEDIHYENSSYYYPFVYEKYLFNILNAGIKDKLEEVISEMIREIRDNREVLYDNVIQIFNQLIGNTIKYLLDARCNIGMIFGNSYNIYNILSAKETLDDIEVWLVEIYTIIADYLVKSRSQSRVNFEQVLDYIHKNYKKDIDINAIAEYAGISYSHLRKVFKDETGENIVNYINNLRINESKRLLCMTNMTIREISMNLGYNNDQSFVRFFKKYEGIAPGEFRISNKIPESSVEDVSVKSNNRFA